MAIYKAPKDTDAKVCAYGGETTPLLPGKRATRPMRSRRITSGFGAARMSLRNRVEQLENGTQQHNDGRAKEMAELVRSRVLELQKVIYGPDWMPPPVVSLTAEERAEASRELRRVTAEILAKEV